MLARRGRGRVRERRLRRDFHLFRLVSNLQREVHRHYLRDWYENSVCYFCFEALFLRFQAVRSGRQRNPVIAGAAGCGCPLYAGLNVRDGERKIGNYGAARILYCSRDGAKIALPRRRAGKQKQSATEQNDHGELGHEYLLRYQNSPGSNIPGEWFRNI